MDFGDVIRTRRMTRRYLDTPVPAELVDRVIEAFRRAPSAGFAQGVSLVVVTDPDHRRRIADRAGEAGYVSRGFEPWLSVAPVHLVVCVRQADYRDRYARPDKAGSALAEGEWPIPYWWLDAGAALMAVLLAAVDAGLAAGFLGAHAIPGLAGEVGLPDDVAAVGVVTIGYPAPEPARLPPRRRPVAEVVHREYWASPPPG